MTFSDIEKTPVAFPCLKYSSPLTQSYIPDTMHTAVT